MVLERLSWRVTRPNHASFRLLTATRRGSCGPTRKLIFSAPSRWSCARALVHKTSDWVWNNINFLVGSTGTSSGNCQETQIRMVRACHTPRQPLQNHPSRHLGGKATPWSVEEMLDGQRQRVDIPAHARTAHNGLRKKKRLEEDLC